MNLPVLLSFFMGAVIILVALIKWNEEFTQEDRLILFFLFTLCFIMFALELTGIEMIRIEYFNDSTAVWNQSITSEFLAPV